MFSVFVPFSFLFSSFSELAQERRGLSYEAAAAAAAEADESDDEEVIEEDDEDEEDDDDEDEDDDDDEDEDDEDDDEDDEDEDEEEDEQAAKRLKTLGPKAPAKVHFLNMPFHYGIFSFFAFSIFRKKPAYYTVHPYASCPSRGNDAWFPRAAV